MGQVNVNAGGPRSTPPEESRSMGAVLGLLAVIIVVLLLAWLLFLRPADDADPAPADNGAPAQSQEVTETGNEAPASEAPASEAPTTDEAEPTGWILTSIA